MTPPDTDGLIAGFNGFFDQLEQGEVDFGEVEETIHPECEFRSAIGSEVDGRTYRGPEQIRGWFEELLEAFALRYEDRKYEVLEEGDILFLTTNKLRGRGSGAEVVRKIGIVFELEDGLIRKVTSYDTAAEARTAAGALHA
jgi:ketosteroid isomerase-like protein